MVKDSRTQTIEEPTSPVADDRPSNSLGVSIDDSEDIDDPDHEAVHELFDGCNARKGNDG